MNPMQLIQMIKHGQNPQQLMLSFLQAEANNPFGANLLNLAKNGQTAEIEKIARNTCCVTAAIENTSTAAILVQNANLTVVRTA